MRKAIYIFKKYHKKLLKSFGKNFLSFLISEYTSYLLLLFNIFLAILAFNSSKYLLPVILGIIFQIGHVIIVSNGGGRLAEKSRKEIQEIIQDLKRDINRDIKTKKYIEKKTDNKTITKEEIEIKIDNLIRKIQYLDTDKKIIYYKKITKHLDNYLKTKRSIENIQGLDRCSYKNIITVLNTNLFEEISKIDRVVNTEINTRNNTSIRIKIKRRALQIK